MVNAANQVKDLYASTPPPLHQPTPCGLVNLERDPWDTLGLTYAPLSGYMYMFFEHKLTKTPARIVTSTSRKHVIFQLSQNQAK